MKVAHLITEGASDRLILESLLPAYIAEQLEIVAAQGRYSAVSRAVSLLAMASRPVALVLAAESTSRAPITELKETIGWELRSSAGGVPFRLLLAVPEVEILLVPDEGTVVAGGTEQSFEREFAREQPKRYLLRKHPELATDYPATLGGFLADFSAEKKRQLCETQPLLRDLIEFVESLTAKAANC